MKLLVISFFLLINQSYSSEIELKQSFNLVTENIPTELWVPLPMNLKGYQTVTSESYTGNADKVEIKQVGSARMMHATWTKSTTRELQIINTIKIDNHGSLDKENVAAYLSPTRHVQTDGIVLATAKKIIGQETDPDKKALAIYNWIVEKTLRDPEIRGCGLGDVKGTLLSGNFKGKCADLNSLFVGLARAANIPAREVFGIRVNQSQEFPSLGKVGDVSKAQHCRAQYYSIKNHTWVPVDPADVRKAILEEKLTLGDSKIQKLKEKFFGQWEGNWAAFNHGRDFTLPNTKYKINYLMYPRLFSKSLSPDGMDPKEVGYVITSRVIISN